VYISQTNNQLLFDSLFGSLFFPLSLAPAGPESLQRTFGHVEQKARDFVGMAV
jgi:hypothetical protein